MTDLRDFSPLRWKKKKCLQVFILFSGPNGDCTCLFTHFVEIGHHIRHGQVPSQATWLRAFPSGSVMASGNSTWCQGPMGTSSYPSEPVHWVIRGLSLNLSSEASMFKPLHVQNNLAVTPCYVWWKSRGGVVGSFYMSPWWALAQNKRCKKLLWWSWLFYIQIQVYICVWNWVACCAPKFTKSTSLSYAAQCQSRTVWDLSHGREAEVHRAVFTSRKPNLTMLAAAAMSQKRVTHQLWGKNFLHQWVQFPSPYRNTLDQFHQELVILLAFWCICYHQKGPQQGWFFSIPSWRCGLFFPNMSQWYSKLDTPTTHGGGGKTVCMGTSLTTSRDGKRWWYYLNQLNVVALRCWKLAWLTSSNASCLVSHLCVEMFKPEFTIYTSNTSSDVTKHVIFQCCCLKHIIFHLPFGPTKVSQAAGMSKVEVTQWCRHLTPWMNAKADSARTLCTDLLDIHHQ